MHLCHTVRLLPCFCMLSKSSIHWTISKQGKTTANDPNISHFHITFDIRFIALWQDSKSYFVMTMWIYHFPILKLFIKSNNDKKDLNFYRPKCGRLICLLWKIKSSFKRSGWIKTSKAQCQHYKRNQKIQ